VNPQAADGYFHDGAVPDHGGDANMNRLFVLDHSLLAALNAREEPVSAGTSAGRAWIKDWDSNRCRYTCDGLIR
jgi:hypothetical protein